MGTKTKHLLRNAVKNGRFKSSRNSTLATALATLLCSSSFWSFCEGVGVHKGAGGAEQEFCYSDAECGPDSHHWGEVCQNGLLQSPISLPARAPVLPGVTALHLGNYRTSAFRMQNNGHTVEIEFQDNPSLYGNGLGGGRHRGGIFAFPDPIALARFGRDERLFYKFDSAHLHWGVRDDVGSEHCFDDRCYSMELHLVHFLGNYNTMEEAMESEDPNALAVIAIMLDVTPAAGQGNPALAPITHNLFQIEEPAHEEWTYINAPLDFTALLATRGQNFMYIYKGSLTTPDCNEQVNWYVFKRPIAISHKDVNGFRYLRDNKGEELRENHRPIQNRNGRPVFLTAIRPV